MTKFGDGREYFPPLAPETRALLDHVHDHEGAREVEIKPSICPSCGNVTNYLVGEAGAGAAVPDAPKPGQPAICSICGAFLYFTRELQLRQLSFSDVLKLPPALRKMLLEARATWLAFQQAEGKA